MKGMDKKDQPQWSPYIAGALAGLLIVLSAWTTGNLFGASTSFVRSAGMIERLFLPDKVAGMEYFRWYVPRIDWQWMFVVGVLVGSVVSSLTSRTFLWKGVPPMWEARFGDSKVRRWTVSFCGGVVAMFGARLAGG